MKDQPGNGNRTILLLLLLSALVVLAYTPSLGGPFALDDIHNIVANPSLRITGLGLADLQKALDIPDNLERRRVAVYFSFALNYLLGGYDPFGYRLANLVILLLSIPFAFSVARTVARTWHDERTATLLALGSSFLWSLHPLLTNGVSYIVQRMTSLCGLFSLIALWAFFRGRGESRRWYAAAALAWLLALSSKEVALLLPLPVMLYLCLASPSGSRAGRRLAWTLGSAVAGSQVLLYLVFRDHEAWAARSFDLAGRLLTEGRVVVHYLGLFLLPLPSRLNLDYDFPLSTSLFDPPSTAAALAVHLALMYAALRLGRRLPLFSFGILSFYLLQLMESTVLPLEIIFEHRTYLPSWFLSLALAEVMVAGGRRILPGREGKAAAVAFLLVAGVWFTWTWQRNTVWTDSLTLARDIAAKSPGKPRALHNLGVVLTERGEYDEALKHLEAALRLDPASGRAHNTAGTALMRMGDPDGARRHFAAAVRLEPTDPRALNNLAVLDTAAGDFEAADKHLQQALLIDETNARTHYNLGRLRLRQRQFDLAAAAYGLAVKYDPRSAEAHFGLGFTAVADGDLEGGAAHFRKALELKPDYPEAVYNLGLVLLKSGDGEGAAALFRRALELRPGYDHALQALEAMEAARRE